MKGDFAGGGVAGAAGAGVCWAVGAACAAGAVAESVDWAQTAALLKTNDNAYLDFKLFK